MSELSRYPYQWYVISNKYIYADGSSLFHNEIITELITFFFGATELHGHKLNIDVHQSQLNVSHQKCITPYYADTTHI